jgi:hypothetical protein
MSHVENSIEAKSPFDWEFVSIEIEW